MCLAFWAPGPWELAVILIVAVLLFANRLPAVGRGIGRGIVELKKGLRGGPPEGENKPEPRK